ncbi:uncharacterized protein TRIADDRAFT_21598 [Trichoplax adhaerens]|uniref:JmjC domain-containing protein 5 n=1 Tax=Trichoplax adhaerens TaxID=10228 RepID=B3RNN1_TRIAD|nr:hypothetical protein TRIADDRAFT_21598 [Trichoplax adhaerens]EDV28047.1 hypothetical protein TRIADDRAFT_21598 [Trichoplax adhaerens]|eukprot:XP_002109881.1 hypothetical protein TRIADDRAFT_21598 [Trichoplax adhaerens]
MSALPKQIFHRLQDDKEIEITINKFKNVTDYGGQRILDILLICSQRFKEERFESCLQLAQCVLDIVWEMLNTGDWKEVPVIWRKVYTYGAIYKAAAYYAMGKLEQCIHASDYGLLMGAPILDNILNDIISAAAARIHPCKQTTSIDDALANAGDHHRNDDIDPQRQITQLSCPSLDYFRKHYFCTKEPVILTDVIDHWPALGARRWSIQRLKDIAGHRTVPIEIGTRYTDDSWTQKLMPLSKFIDEFITMESNQESGYLAQHQLFEQIPELRTDICVPDYCCIIDDNNDDVDATVLTNAWFGPQGTISPLHHDPYHNLFAQVMGRKYIRLYPEHESENVYPYPTKLLSNTSQVDVEFPNFENYPNFANAEYLECIIEPGQLLYIPPRCWHYVRSLDISFSVSFWW